MTKEERHQTHADAITAQLGTRATPASLLLAQRIAGLAVFCEEHEAGRLKSARDYMNAAKLMQTLCIAIGVVLNPRTATSRQRADAAHDDHAAVMLDED